jgi:ribose transport system permease protein
VTKAQAPAAGELGASDQRENAEASERRSTAVVVGVVAIVVIVAVALTPNFVSADNLRAILRNASIVGIVAVAMTPITLSGNFLSLGTSQSAMAGAVLFVALVGAGFPWLPAILVVLLALVIVGVLQGAVVAEGLNPVITTLAAGAIIYGVVANLTDGRIVTVGSHGLSWGNSLILGVPIEVVVFLLFTIVVGVVVTRTAGGREMTLMGANKATAELNGISFRRVTLGAFVVLSIGLAIAGVLNGAGFGEASILSLNSLTVDALAAILVGGTAITGGYGSPWRSAAGAVLIAVITNVMILNDFSTGGRLAIKGAVVLIVVILLGALMRRREVH